ncbi:MAG: hypothetical protein LiPW15_157 [Parcubacteria group bacterium LiPW_15]|nr:MAG: hypothetical protein LiPW15_157 [Parcubacteria group bacterium LiPW_15]
MASVRITESEGQNGTSRFTMSVYVNGTTLSGPQRGTEVEAAGEMFLENPHIFGIVGGIIRSKVAAVDPPKGEESYPQVGC